MISDREIVQRTGLLDMLKKTGEGSSVRLIKKLDIQDLLVTSGVKLNILPFLKKGPRLIAHDVQRAQQIAKVRTHVECLIEQVKDLNILT